MQVLNGQQQGPGSAARKRQLSLIAQQQQDELPPASSAALCLPPDHLHYTVITLCIAAAARDSAGSPQPLCAWYSKHPRGRQVGLLCLQLKKLGENMPASTHPSSLLVQMLQIDTHCDLNKTRDL